jgi:hypothetical protein
MQLALYLAAEDEPHHDRRTHGTDEVKPFAKSIVILILRPNLAKQFSPKKAKMIHASLQRFS